MDSLQDQTNDKLTDNLKFSKNDSHLKGFQEAVLSVINLELSVSFFQRICGWEIIARNEKNKTLNALWGLNGEVEIEEVVLRNPKEITGFLRIVKFKNVAQKAIRASTRIWDSGGIFDLNMRAKDIDQLCKAFEDEGWNGFGEPHRFTFGKFDVSEVLMKGPHGITFALMQRFAPPLVGYDHLAITSRVFNSTTICKNLDVSVDFFINKLGFKTYFQTAGNERSHGENVIGIPPNINGDIDVPIYIVHPNGENTGSIELLETKQLKGRNVSRLAKPPNLGILMLRFPVADCHSYAKELQAKGVQLNSEVHAIEIHPYGKMNIFSVITPDGVWLEFMEKLS